MLLELLDRVVEWPLEVEEKLDFVLLRMLDGAVEWPLEVTMLLRLLDGAVD